VLLSVRVLCGLVCLVVCARAFCGWAYCLVRVVWCGVCWVVCASCGNYAHVCCAMWCAYMLGIVRYMLRCVAWCLRGVWCCVVVHVGTEWRVLRAYSAMWYGVREVYFFVVCCMG